MHSRREPIKRPQPAQRAAKCFGVGWIHPSSFVRHLIRYEIRDGLSSDYSCQSRWTPLAQHIFQLLQAHLGSLSAEFLNRLPQSGKPRRPRRQTRREGARGHRCHLAGRRCHRNSLHAAAVERLAYWLRKELTRKSAHPEFIDEISDEISGEVPK